MPAAACKPYPGLCHNDDKHLHQMKLSKEAKIGTLVLFAIVIFFAGFYFLKGSNVFSSEYQYYADYNSVQGLTASAAVQIKGVNVGKVTDIELKDDGKVRVTLSIAKATRIPSGSIAELISLDLLGTKAVRLNLGSSPQMAKNKEVLPASVETGIIDNISSEISPLVKDVRAVVATLDSVLLGIHGILNDETRENLHSSVASLDVTMKNFADLSKKLNAESDQLASVIRNANSITTNIKDNNEHISNVIKNAESIHLPYLVAVFAAISIGFAEPYKGWLLAIMQCILMLAGYHFFTDLPEDRARQELENFSLYGSMILTFAASFLGGFLKRALNMK